MATSVLEQVPRTDKEREREKAVEFYLAEAKANIAEIAVLQKRVEIDRRETEAALTRLERLF